jgi:hypothetical protein
MQIVIPTGVTGVVGPTALAMQKFVVLSTFTKMLVRYVPDAFF